MFTMDYFSEDSDIDDKALDGLDYEHQQMLRKLVKEGEAQMAEQEALEEEERHAREEAEGIADLNAEMLGIHF